MLPRPRLFLYPQRIFARASVSGGYALARKNPLRIKALRDHHGDQMNCAARENPLGDS